MPARADFSVVIPTFNRANRLNKALRAVCDQNVDGLEVIVVDNNSTDGTSELVQDWPDDRVIYTRCTTQGIYHALNHGFKRTSGEMLTWTSDDNWYHRGALGLLKTAISSLRVDMVYSDYRTLNETTGREARTRVGSPDMLDANCCVGACFLWTKRVYQRVGDHCLRFRYSADYDYWLRIRRHGFSMQGLHQDAPYTFVNHPQAVTRLLTGPAYAEALAIRVRHGCFRRLWRRQPDLFQFSQVYLDIRRLYLHGWFRAACTLLGRALQYRPGCLKNWRYATGSTVDLIRTWI
jgi:glycosyltransferase involved in cell wall biosynthesis